MGGCRQPYACSGARPLTRNGGLFCRPRLPHCLFDRTLSASTSLDMKRILLLIAFAASAAFAAVEINKPIAELTLKDGRTLKNVVFVSYSSSAIMAKWEGGRGTIPYDALPADVGEAVKMMRAP